MDRSLLLYILLSAGGHSPRSLDLCSNYVVRNPGRKWDGKFQGCSPSEILLLTEIVCHSCSSFTLEKENKSEGQLCFLPVVSYLTVKCACGRLLI